MVKDTESARSKVAIFQAKIEELEQHVGMARITDPPPVDLKPEGIHQINNNSADIVNHPVFE